MRTNKTIAGFILAISYPIMYYAWVCNIKNTWLQNDIIEKHSDILRPEVGRFNLKDPTRQFQQALIFKPIDDKKVVTSN